MAKEIKKKMRRLIKKMAREAGGSIAFAAVCAFAAGLMLGVSGVVPAWAMATLAVIFAALLVGAAAIAAAAIVIVAAVRAFAEAKKGGAFNE